VLKDRLAGAVATWKSRDVTSSRLLVTAVGILVVVVPIGLWGVIAGPTAKDRLGAAGFTLVALLFGGFSLWEAKSPVHRGRSRRPDDAP
jgi:hypothetical protein